MNGDEERVADRDTLEPEFAPAREALARLQRRALLVGGAALLLAIVGALFDPRQALRSWLTGWLFWLGIGLGSLALLLIDHVTAGRWGLPVRRLLEAATRTLPLLALLMVPLLVGVKLVYPWAEDGFVAGHGHTEGGHSFARTWLRVPFFTARAAGYFVAWIALATFVDRLSRRRDAEPGPDSERRIRVVAGPGLVVYALGMTFAAIDWGMSLEPAWRSTIYGVIVIVGQILATLAFVLVAGGALRGHAPFRETLTPPKLHDLGNLSLAFVLLWSYVSFSQFLIVWSANLPVEATWYVRRLEGGWQAIALLLLLFHFATPFLVLLSRKAKRSARVLAIVAAGLLVMRLLETHWLVAPAYRARLGMHWLDLVTPVAIGGLWLALWSWQLRRRPLAPPVPLPSAVEPATAAAHGEAS